jgi:uncharacterized membrane protein YcaP (DUF421 family)
MFFDGWWGIWRVLIVGILSYVTLVLMVRISGKRTLSKMNAFDLIVTVALGSTLATIILSEDVAFAQGVLALALLVAMQYVVAWLSVKSKRARTLFKSEPSMLFYRGDYLSEAMGRERVTEEEVRSAIRSEGIAALDSVTAVVLETDGTFSVVGSGAGGDRSSLQDVTGAST